MPEKYEDELERRRTKQTGTIAPEPNPEEPEEHALPLQKITKRETQPRSSGWASEDQQ